MLKSVLIFMLWLRWWMDICQTNVLINRDPCITVLCYHRSNNCNMMNQTFKIIDRTSEMKIIFGAIWNKIWRNDFALFIAEMGSQPCCLWATSNTGIVAACLWPTGYIEMIASILCRENKHHVWRHGKQHLTFEPLTISPIRTYDIHLGIAQCKATESLWPPC